MKFQMIDLHSHLLPNIDDGSSSLQMSLQMASMAVEDGIEIMVCTPHIQAGVYDNSASKIRASVASLRQELEGAGIPLNIEVGADIHVSPGMVAGLKEGNLVTLAGGRYFLFEPPHHIAPPGLLSLVREIVAEGFIPVLTHPERLTWIENQYETICAIDEAGAAVQLTAASITGGFGERAKYWSERMLDEGRVDIVASDAHHPKRRPPILSKARAAIAKRMGDDIAQRFFYGNPAAILQNEDLPQKQRKSVTTRSKSWLPSWFGRS
jgi:protein-tyrosine phosphatase